MRHWILLISLFSLGLMVLTACAAPGTPASPTSAPAGPTPPAQKTEAPTPVEQASNTPAATAAPAATETPSAETSSLEGQTWKLDWYLDSQGQQTKVLAGTEITAEFKDGNLGGNAGCNSYFGSYQVDGNMLKVSGIGSTMMACLETGVMEQEQAYLAALGQSATFQAQADSLQIADAGGKTILAYSVLQPLPLTGTLWELTAYNNGKQAVVSLLAGTKITAFFAADNSLTGSAGCNTYTASYKVNGDQIQIGSAASTMMFCSQPDGVMDQETAYLKALESANTYEISGDQLTLRTADGATAASYHAVQPTPLVGTQWQLTAYNNGKGGVVSTVSGSQVTALFSEDGKLTGSAGCNNYTAAYKATGDKIQISQAASTLMMCAEPQGVMEQETAYLQAIGKAATYQIEGDQLTLRGSDGATLASYQASVGTALVNTHWQLTSYNNGKEAVVSVLEGSDVTAIFGADGKLAGSGGCNNYTADYQVDGSSLHIGPAASTRKLCAEPQGIMEQEAAYLQALEKAATYQIQGDKLEIRDANGALLASYQANLLFGTRWDWVETKYGNDTSLAPSQPGKYQLFFLPDEVLDLLADCTAIAGKYTVQGGTMTIDLSNAGNVNCGADSQATQFVRDAESAVSYLIKDGQLYIALKLDTGIMQFTPGQP